MPRSKAAAKKELKTLRQQVKAMHMAVDAVPKALAEVVCADLSSVSLATSAARFERLNLSEYVSILEVNLLELDPALHGRFDYIVHRWEHLSELMKKTRLTQQAEQSEADWTNWLAG